MPLSFTTAQAAILESEFCSFIGLVRVATPAPVRLWTGVGDFPVVNSAFDVDGTIYKGGGRLISLPIFQRIWNGIAERISVVLNGVTADMQALVYDEADDVRGAILRMGIAILDGDWKQVGPVRWLRRGRVDMIETDNAPGDGERTRQIIFSLGSQLTGRRIPGAGTWTNGDQQLRPGSEDDRFCERTSILTQNVQVKWPSFQ